jgi:hypothetical protein
VEGQSHCAAKEVIPTHRLLCALAHPLLFIQSLADNASSSSRSPTKRKFGKADLFHREVNRIQSSCMPCCYLVSTFILDESRAA